MILLVTVRNLGKADARGAKLSCVLSADGRQIARQDFTFDVSANGTYPAKWEITAPASRQLQLAVYAMVAQDSNPSNNQAAITINLVSAPPRVGTRTRRP